MSESKITEGRLTRSKKCVGGMALLAVVELTKESSPSTHISFLEGLELIQRDEANIRTLTEERKELRRSKKRVQKIYSSLTGYEEKIYYNRVILKETQQRTAEKIGLSVRQEQRIEGDMKDRGLI